MLCGAALLSVNLRTVPGSDLFLGFAQQTVRIPTPESSIRSSNCPIRNDVGGSAAFLCMRTKDRFSRSDDLILPDIPAEIPANRILHDIPVQHGVEVEMQMPGQYRLHQCLPFQVIDESLRRPVCPLLSAPFLRIRLQQLLRRSDQVCAPVPPLDHHLPVQGDGMKRVVQQQQDRISFLLLKPERLQFFRAELVVGIVHRHKIAPADQARCETQVVPDIAVPAADCQACTPHPRQFLRHIC